MMQIALIGVGAGAAAALLFGSVTSGIGLSVILFYLAPLPIMIVALGWSHWAGLTAAVAAVALLGFAVIHTATRHMRGRAVVLSGAYGCVVLLVWPVLVMTLIGVAETLFGLRVRSSRRGPPAARST